MEICVSKLYGPPKKRSILSIRKFPRGCGMKAPATITDPSVEVKQLAPSSETACEDKKEEHTKDVAIQEDKVPNGTNDAEKSLVEVNELAHSSGTACSDKKEEHTQDVAIQEGKVPSGTNAAEKSLVEVNQLTPSSETACSEKNEGHDEDVNLQEKEVPNGINVDAAKSLVDNDTIAEIKEKKEGHTIDAALQEDKWYTVDDALQQDTVPNGVNVFAEKSLVDNVTNGEIKDLHRPLADAEVELCTSKVYGPPKRRKLTAIRRFPLGCGPLASIKEIRYVSSEANNLIKGMEPTVNKTSLLKDSSSAKGSQKATSDLNGRVDYNQGETVIGVSTTHITEGSISGIDTKKDMFDDDMDMFTTEKESSLIRDKSLSKPNHYKKSSNKRRSLPGEAELTNKSLMEDSNSLHKRVKTEKLKGKASSAIVDEKPQFQKSHGKDLSTTESKIPYKVGAVEKDPRSPVRKSILVKHGNGTKDKKRKYTEELEEDRRESTPVCKSENVNCDSSKDRVIILALKAAQNCPWRHGKGSARAVQQSSSPAVKSKKKMKSSKKRSECHDLSDSHDICVYEAQSEDLPLEIVPQDEDFSDKDTERRLLTYEYPQELSVMETPSKPPNWNRSGTHEEVGMRNKVRRALRLFQVICRKLLQGEESKSRGKGKGRVDLEAADIMKKKNEYVNPGKSILGLVPGVEIGDEFHYRTELAVIGLHRPFQAGIDKTKVGDIFLATSIVAGCGSDEMESSDVLVYSGSGGSSGDGDKAPEDQKLEGGNLALKNSMEAKEPVRVIRSSKEVRVDSRDGKTKTFSTFVYDGLYIVEKYWKERVRQGFLALKFELRRIPGQPQLPSKEVKKSPKPSVRPGVCIKDISDVKEKMPICVVNTIDNDRPSPFRYITRIRYPSSFELKAPKGCDCTNGCSDSEKCACAVKNGGEIPYNYNGAIVQAKPLVYECGPMCKCPPTCHNRVSQHGIKIQLEVFKTESMGWGVRSLSSIASGSFICEYIGELIPDTEAELRTNDEYLFDIGHNYDDHSLWEGLPTLIPELQSSSSQEDKDGAGFTIDAAEFANVGRFINHSCSPNLYAQNVLYDHDDKRMPHIMLFAAENIPPLQELTYHYNYMIDQVRDGDGNIKRKDCYCGSDECTGRLY